MSKFVKLGEAEKRENRTVLAPLGAMTAVFFALTFLIGCGGLSEDVLDEIGKPFPKDFLIGPEDMLEVNVWKNQDLSRTTVVRPDGMISLPLIGDVRASGRTAVEVSNEITERLRAFKENPSVSVSVKEINSYFIFVVGEVLKPGKYQLKSYTTLLQAISMAGGFTPFAKKGRLRVVRTSPNGDGRLHEIRIPVRYDDLIAGQGETVNFVLKSGDTLVVP